MRRVAILLLILLAFGLRIFRIETQSYWIDEAWTVNFIHLSTPELWHLLGSVEIHPPLYYTPLHFWVLLVGDGEFFLRFFSLFDSVLAVVFVYQLGRQIGEFQVGWIAGLLLAIAPYQIWHAQEARMYAALMAATSCNLYWFVRLIKARKEPFPNRFVQARGIIFYALSLAWAILTHYHGVFLIGIQGLTCLVFWWRSKWQWQPYLSWALGVVLGLVLCAPWLIYSASFLLHHQSWIPQPTLLDALVRSAFANSVGEIFPHAVAWGPALLYSMLFVIGLFASYFHGKAGWRQSECTLFLVSATLAPVLAAWLYGQVRTTLFYERYLIFTQIGFLLAVTFAIIAIADAVGRLVRPLRYPVLTLLIAACAACSAWALNLYYYNPAYAREDWRSLAAQVNAFAQPNAGVIITGDGGEKAFAYYWHGTQRLYADFNTPTPTQAQAEQLLNQIAADHEQIWYSPYGLPIDDVIEPWLMQHTFPAWSGWLGRKRLAVYEIAKGSHWQSIESSIDFADSNPPEAVVHLKQIEFPTNPVPAGDLLPLRTTWQVDKAVPQNLQLSLRLIGANGALYTQAEWPPLVNGKAISTWEINQPQIDQRSLWIPADTPPALYSIQAVLYDNDTGQAWGSPSEIAKIKVAPSSLNPSTAVYAIGHRWAQSLNGVQLIGYAAPDQIRPGDKLWLWLYFQADPQQPNPPPEQTIQLVYQPAEGSGSRFEGTLSQLFGDLPHWLPGQVRRAYVELPTDSRLNTTQIAVQLTAQSTSTAVSFTLPPISVVTRQRSFAPPKMQQQSDAQFGAPVSIALLGYDLPTTNVAAGKPLPVTFYWQQQRAMSIDYTVFVQLLNAEGRLVAQMDQQPHQGEAPTSGWLDKEVIVDSYTLQLPAELTPGTYRLIVGFYDAVSGQRLPVAAGGDFVDVSTIELNQLRLRTP